jgi:hypothetical protein
MFNNNEFNKSFISLIIVLILFLIIIYISYKLLNKFAMGSINNSIEEEQNLNENNNEINNINNQNNQNFNNQNQNLEPKKLTKKEQQKMLKKKEKEEHRLQMKQFLEAKKQKEQEKERERIKKEKLKEEKEKEYEEALKKAKEEEKQKEDELYNKWKDQIKIGEEGEEKFDFSNEKIINEFLNYIKIRKVISLEDLSGTFKLSPNELVEKLNYFEKEGKILGIIDDRGKYIYITEKEMKMIEKMFLNRGIINKNDFIRECNRIIRFEPNEEDKIKIQNEQKKILEKFEKEIEKK